MHLKRAATLYRELWKSSRVYRFSVLASMVLVVVTVVLPLARLWPNTKGAPFIPLHYNIYLGVDQFGPWERLLLIPVLGIGLFLLNMIFEGWYFRREHVLATFFSVATVLAEATLFISMVFIVLLNI
jgi:hypothetical protein